MPNFYNQPYTDPIFVAGEDAANSHPVAAGHTGVFFDSRPDVNVFYTKTVDPNGVAQPLRIFDYTERERIRTEPASVKEIEDVKKDIYEVKNDISKLANMLQELLGPTEGSK